MACIVCGYNVQKHRTERPTTMQHLRAYEAFLAVLDAGSIAAASRALGAPRPTVTRRLAQLEDGLGVRLLHRTPKGLHPTREGTVLADRVRPLLRGIEDAEGALERLDDRPRGLLRVSMPPLVTRYLRPTLLAYRAACPDVVLQIQSTNRYVDLRAEQIDVAVRGGVLRDQDLVARLLVRSRAVAVAAPGLVPEDVTLDTLDQHPCLLGQADDDGWGTWPLLDGGNVRVRGHLVTNDRALLGAAARDGQGIALMSTLTIERELVAGALVPVLPALVGRTIGLYVVYAERGLLAPRTRAFVDHVVQAFSADQDRGRAVVERAARR